MIKYHRFPGFMGSAGIRKTNAAAKPKKAARSGQPFLEKEKKMKKLIGD